MEFKDILTITMSSISAAIACVAIYRTGIQAEKQRAFAERLNAETKAIERKRFFTELWDRMSGLNYIDSAKPIWPDVRRAVNALDAVAMCWEADIVDKGMVVVAFGSLYVTLYRQISELATPYPGVGKTGRELLAASDVGPRVYEQIQYELRRLGRTP